jgi:hypothetical protein
VCGRTSLGSVDRNFFLNRGVAATTFNWYRPIVGAGFLVTGGGAAARIHVEQIRPTAAWQVSGGSAPEAIESDTHLSFAWK